MSKSLKVNFRLLSEYKCRCGRPLKLNVVNRKLEVPAMCYRCWVSKEASRGHRMQGSERKAVS